MVPCHILKFSNSVITHEIKSFHRFKATTRNMPRFITREKERETHTQPEKGSNSFIIFSWLVLFMEGCVCETVNMDVAAVLTP